MIPIAGVSYGSLLGLGSGLAVGITMQAMQHAMTLSAIGPILNCGVTGAATGATVGLISGTMYAEYIARQISASQNHHP